MLDSRTYPLAATLSLWDCEVVRRVSQQQAKRLQVQMKPQLFSSFDPISIHSFLSAFKWEYDMNSVSEGTAFRIKQYFMDATAATALEVRFAPKSEPLKLRNHNILAPNGKAVT